MAVLLGLTALVQRIRQAARPREQALRAAPYAIGIQAAFWFFERLARF